MRAVILDLDTLDRDDLDLGALKALLPELRCYRVTPPAKVAERIAAAEVVLTNKVRLDRGALGGASNLRLICLSATGTNNVDLDAARDCGIAVANIRGYCTASVVQHVFALVLALNVHLANYQARLKAGAWRESPQFTLLDFPIRELAGLTLGIVGYGALGRGVAHLGEAFGMRVLLAARPDGPVPNGRLALTELLPKVDVLSLHCPLTAATLGLIGARELALMKPDALLINTARGALLDEQALAEALRARRLGGAGIDVLSEEPPVNGNPLLAGDIPNLIVTPHIAWAARAARQRAVDEMAENIAAFKAGKERNRVV
jgi:glycerate dehydrogenase